MKKLPQFLKQYFWDVDFEELDWDKRKLYILKRVLEYGDGEAVSWMWKSFKKNEIKNALIRFRGYSSKTANYWAVILNVKKGDVKCLSKSLREIQKQFWPY